MTIASHLILWKSDFDLLEDYERRYKTVHAAPAAENDPTLLLMSHLFQHRTEVLAELLHAGDILDWYCWDNDMGKKGQRYFIPGFYPRRPVRTLKALEKLILAHTKSKAASNP